MESPKIPHSELFLYLPNSVILDVLEFPARSPLRAEHLNSPQITPLESRLHTYLLGQSGAKDRAQLNLSKLFESIEVETEIERELSRIGSHEVSLFSALCDGKIFEQAEQEIHLFLQENHDPKLFN